MIGAGLREGRPPGCYTQPPNNCALPTPCSQGFLLSARVSSSVYFVDIDRPDTWTRFRSGLCDQCAANCCTMPVEIRLPDLVRLGLVDAFEAEHEAPKQIAKRLSKARLIDHFHTKHEVFTLARRANGDCHLLDATTRRCTRYEQRPSTCRKHPQVGPRPGYCPYGTRARSA